MADAFTYVVPEGFCAGWTAERNSRRRIDSAAPRSLSANRTPWTHTAGTAVSVAETGTIVIDATPNRTRRAVSLVRATTSVVGAAVVTGILPEAMRVSVVPSRRP